MSLKILIIEDDNITAKVVEEGLTTVCGHQVWHAHTCKEGFRILNDNDFAFDIIVLDYNLPDGTGLSFFCDLFCSRHDEIPVVMLSAEESREILIEFLKMGGADFVQKPVGDFMIFDAVLRHAVQVADAKRHLRDMEAKKLAAEEAKAFMEDVIAKLGHELGTPLHHLKSAVNIAIKEIGNGNMMKAVEWLTMAGQSNLRMTRLVNDISDLSRLQRGKLSIRKRLSNITEITRQAANEVLQSPKVFEGEMVLEVSNMPVLCDPERLTQVCVNLLKNALQHGGGDRVKLCAFEHDHRLVCRVEDNGKGIAVEKMERIFKPFEQGNNAYNASGNLGVGLAISRELINLHNGEIRAFPNRPKGTVFEFNIPLERGVLQ